MSEQDNPRAIECRITGRRSAKKEEAPRPDSMLEAALAYGKLGLRVLPIWSFRDDGNCACGKPNDADNHSPGKHSIWYAAPNGVKNASSDEAQIKRWWTRYPNANIGIATGEVSGIFVLDVDPDKGGEESLQNLINENGPLPPGAKVRTGGGGEHYYFANPVGEQHRRKATSTGTSRGNAR